MEALWQAVGINNARRVVECLIGDQVKTTCIIIIADRFWSFLQMPTAGHLSRGLDGLGRRHGDGAGSGAGPGRQRGQAVGRQRLGWVHAVDAVGGRRRAVGTATCR